MNSRATTQYAQVYTASRRSGSAKRRLEVVWAWASLAALIVCWDAALRLDQHVSPPRMRLSHAADMETPEPTSQSTLAIKRR